MRKIFLAAFCFIIFSANICCAIEKNEFSLGGITPDMTYNDIIARYGEPTEKLKGYAQLVSSVIMYGDSVEFGFIGRNDPKITYVVVTKNNGWTTPSNIHVGMPIDDVIEIYGSDYSTRVRKQSDIHQWMIDSGEPYYEYHWFGTEYTWKYFINAELSYALSVVENDGKVTAIKLRRLIPEH
ncbi:MAG: hypothetical protein IKZ58_03635 [Selenomonadaceae bacterium]|nr:hypothetical protein [Selenomonadaceae bacterium]